MSWICDTGPVIALAKLDRLDILASTRHGPPLIPPAVRRELLARVGPEAEVIDQALQGLLRVQEPPAPSFEAESAAAVLDRGEREVILLAASLGGEAIVLMDDQAGRRVARQLDLPVVGTAGLLLLAKAQGQVQAVAPLLVALRDRGYWLSDALVAEVRRRAGEA